MKKFTLLSVLFLGSMFASFDYTVFPFTIQYPGLIHEVPQTCLYQSGERYIAEIDEEGKRACFILPVDKLSTHFHLLITDGDVLYEKITTDENNNTMLRHKIDPNHPYKYYELELVRTKKKRKKLYSEPEETTPKKDYWIVTEKKLEDGSIPDEAIIVRLNADHVDMLCCNNEFEFPTVIIKKNIISLVGSEQKLQEQSIELLLTTLDYNLLHSNVEFHTKQDKKKIIVAMSTI